MLPALQKSHSANLKNTQIPHSAPIQGHKEAENFYCLSWKMVQIEAPLEKINCGNDPKQKSAVKHF